MSVKRGLLQLALAALLLAAQHGALTHQAQHVREPLPAQSRQQDPAKNSAHAGLCKFHVSYAEVLGAVDCAHVPLRIAACRAEAGAHAFPHSFLADLVVPASRGPPVLL